MSIVFGVFKVYDVSESGSASVIRCKRKNDPNKLGLLERARLDHWPWFRG
jgi:hypothetical protein